MRMRRWVVVGALAASAGAGACADALAPDAAAVERDLDVFVPSVLVSPEGAPVDEVGALRPVRSTSGTVPFREGDPIPAHSVGFDGVGDPEPTQGDAPSDATALVLRPYLTLEFTERRLFAEYGFIGLGWGYDMSMIGDVWYEDGRHMRPLQGTGRAEHLPFPWYLRPTKRDEFHVSSRCGATAEATARFTAFVGFPGLKVMQVQEARRTLGQQEVCPSPETGSGAPDPVPTTTNDGFQICYYEVWADQNGVIVEVFLIRCESLGGGSIPWAEVRAPTESGLH